MEQIPLAALALYKRLIKTSNTITIEESGEVMHMNQIETVRIVNKLTEYFKIEFVQGRIGDCHEQYSIVYFISGRGCIRAI